LPHVLPWFSECKYHPQHEFIKHHRRISPHNGSSKASDAPAAVSTAPHHSTRSGHQKASNAGTPFGQSHGRTAIICRRDKRRLKAVRTDSYLSPYKTKKAEFAKHGTLKQGSRSGGKEALKRERGCNADIMVPGSLLHSWKRRSKTGITPLGPRYDFSMQESILLLSRKQYGYPSR
jgi:hypothetical protein